MRTQGNEWADILAETHRVKIDKVPPGWLTIYQLRDKYFNGMSVQHVRNLVNPLLGEKLERRKFRIRPIPGGYIRQIYHYRIKK